MTTDEGWPGCHLMTRLARMQCATVLIGMLGLASCTPDAPVLVRGTVIDAGLIAGEFTRRQEGTERIWRLSGRQLDEMHAWMGSHYPDLHMSLATPPLPSFSVVTFDATENRTQIDLFSVNESWRHAVQAVVARRDGRLIYGGQLSLAPEDIASLRRMLADKA